MEVVTVKIVLKDIFFPKFCVGCGFIGSYICLSCQKKLIVNEDTCLYCKKRSYLGLTHPGCSSKYRIDGLVSAFLYNPTMKKIIKNIKYRLATDIFNDLFKILPSEFIQKISALSKLVNELNMQAVPLHPHRLKQRGFNQSEVLRDYLSNHVNCLSVVNVLKRVKNTFPQAQLNSKKEKYLNIKGAFRIIDEMNIERKSFVLIDDVVTTGSTVKEACRILKSKKSGKVFVFAIAKS